MIYRGTIFGGAEDGLTVDMERPEWHRPTPVLSNGVYDQDAGYDLWHYRFVVTARCFKGCHLIGVWYPDHCERINGPSRQPLGFQ